MAGRKRFDPLRSFVGEGFVSKDGFVMLPSDGGDVALRRFELKDDLTADNTAATAYLLTYDATTEEYAIDENVEFELYSFIGFTGVGRVVEGEGEEEEITDGTRGWCTKKDGRWEVVGNSTAGYDRITGLTTAAVDGSGFTIDNVDVVKGADPREDTSSSAETVTIVNTPGWKMADNQRIFAHWDERLNSGDGGWEVYLVYSTVTVVTDVTISNRKLKKKTKTIGVFYAGTESDWSAGVNVLDSDDLDEITFMTNVQVSGTTLQKKTRKIIAYNPDGNDESDWSTWHTGTECE